MTWRVALALALLLPVSAAAEVLSIIRKEPLVARLSQEGGNYSVEIRLDSASSQKLENVVFTLPNPTRLVIDLPGRNLKLNLKKDISKGIFQFVRVGSHPDKTRIVFDLSGSNPPELTTSTDKGRVLILLKGLDDTAQPVAEAAVTPTPTPTQSPTPTPKPASISTPTPSVTPAPKPSVTPEPSRALSEEELRAEPEEEEEESSPPPIAKPAPPNPIRPISETKSSITAIDFRMSGSTPALLLKGSNLGSYSLQQIESNHFEVIIDGAALANEQLRLPQFPPDSFRGFEVVSAEIRPGSVAVILYVEEGARLEPFRSGEDLWIKVLPAS